MVLVVFFWMLLLIMWKERSLVVLRRLVRLPRGRRRN
jgi:hypothetical protein